MTNQDKNLAKVIEEIPEEKLPKKIRESIVGIALGAAGCLTAIVAFAITLRLVWVGAAIDMWTVIFVAIPFGVGLFLMAWGALITSRELASAGLKDFTAAVRSVWKGKNGGSNG